MIKIISEQNNRRDLNESSTDSLKNKYFKLINDSVNNKFKTTDDGLSFISSDYRELQKVLSSVKDNLSDIGFKLKEAVVEDDADRTLYTYEYSEFGYVITIHIIFDETDWDNSSIIIKMYVDDEDTFSGRPQVIPSNPKITESNIKETYDPNWIEKADDDDLVLLRGELGSLDVNAERLYKAVRRSEDRGNKSDINNLTSAIKKINNDLSNLAAGWESNPIKESINTDSDWEKMETKSVQDSDGFYTEYTLWHNTKTDTWECIFGDSELYTPENEYPDAEFDEERQARDWFNNYNGFEDEDDLHFYESHSRK